MSTEEAAEGLPTEQSLSSSETVRWQLHNLVVEGLANDAAVRASWQQSFSSLTPVAAPPDLRCALQVVEKAPPPPPGQPDFQHVQLLEYYLATPRKDLITAYFPGYGRLEVDLARGETRGRISREVVAVYGLLEDMVAVALSPHLRRRGLFFVHAFGAAWQGQGVLIVGGVGAGKTTTGMALLNAGWQLLSNDSPLVDENGQARSYPGVLAAYPDAFARLPRTAALAEQPVSASGRQKISVTAESIWPDVWLATAPVAAIVFPQIEPREQHLLEPLRRIETLRRLLPQSLEQWDRATMPRHLAVLRDLVERAPGYVLRLGPDVTAIPPLLREVVGAY